VRNKAGLIGSAWPDASLRSAGQVLVLGAAEERSGQ